MTEEAAKRFVKDLIQLNEPTYDRMYNEEQQSPALHEMFTTQKDTKRIETLQLLKFLQCIHYNIDLNTIRTGRNGQENHEIKQRLLNSYETLTNAIEELKSTIINELTNYKELNYSNAI